MVCWGIHNSAGAELAHLLYSVISTTKWGSPGFQEEGVLNVNLRMRGGSGD